MQPKVDVPIPDDGAKVLVVKFNDYQCPRLQADPRNVQGRARQVRGSRAGPLRRQALTRSSRSATSTSPGGNHYASCEAAAAVVMAQGEGHVDEDGRLDLRQLRPAGAHAEQVKQAARDVGGIQDFDAQYARALEEVKTDAGLGKLLDVRSTPTFFINGRQACRRRLQPQYLDVIIDLELKRAK